MGSVPSGSCAAGRSLDYISESIDALYPHSVFVLGAASGGKPGLSAEYFSNAQLEGTPVVQRLDPAIDFKTGNESPLPAIAQDSAFSIRWRGAIQPSQTDDFIFAGMGSGGWRILLDGKVVIDKWTLHNHGSSEDVVPLRKNQVYQLAVEYSHPEGSAEMHFGWAHPQVSPAEQGQIKSADAVIYAGGFNPETEQLSSALAPLRMTFLGRLLLKDLQPDLLQTLGRS